MGPLVKGELTLDGRITQWRARVAGFDVPVRVTENTVTFTLPEQSEFRGHLRDSGKQIAGHWIQGAGPYPYNNRYASPTELVEVAPRVWRGTVNPLEQRISFYLQVDRSSSGGLSAFIRNPEANLFRRRTWDVQVNDGAVLLSNQDQRLEGRLDRENHLLWLGVLDGQPPLAFSRRDRSTAVGFYPRATTSEYAYQVPIAENDGWKVGSLSDAGLDPSRISELVQKILAAAPSLSNPVNIHSLLIARHGKLVLEEYFYGYDKNRAHDMRSASKTYASVLVGMAHDHNPTFGPDSAVYPLFKKYEPFSNWDQRKAKMKVRDLLQMTTGYYCDDSDDAAPGAEDNVQNQNKQPDWYKYTLDLPMASEPGGDLAVYCSIDSNLAMGTVRQVTGEWLPDFFNHHFAKPLGITSYFMNLMPTGEAYGGGGLQLRPRDELKLGQLYLSGGVWNGQRILSEQWVRESLSLRAHFQQRMDIDVDHGYGYGWHTRPVRVGGRVVRHYFAAGNGGQLVIVIPDLDMVVVMNGGDYAEARKFFRFEIELLPQYILAAAIH
jgi:CubicO group peptidase (beta-lactamase class C family)